MTHTLSGADRDFRSEFESGKFPAAAFNHRKHLELAYVYLAESEVDAAVDRMKKAILGFLEHNGVDPVKYHETITRAWILVVRHFMEITPDSGSADELIRLNPVMLDTNVMLTHYSAGLLFSDEARRQFAEPDLDPIPRYGQ